MQILKQLGTEVELTSRSKNIWVSCSIEVGIQIMNISHTNSRNIASTPNQLHFQEMDLTPGRLEIRPDFNIFRIFLLGLESNDLINI